MRNRQIDRENAVLYDKLKKIMESHAKDNKSFGNGVSISKTGVPTIDCWNTSENDYSSLNLGRRKQEFDKINRENEVILDALEKTQSYYPRKELLEEYEHKQFLFSLCAKRPAVGLPRSPKGSRRGSPRSARSPRKLPPLQSTQETCNGEESLKPEPPKTAPNSARPNGGGRRIVEHNEEDIDPVGSEINPTISSTTNNNNIQQEESTQQSVILEDVNEDPSTVEQPTPANDEEQPSEQSQEQLSAGEDLEPPAEPTEEETKPAAADEKPAEEAPTEEEEKPAEEEEVPTEEEEKPAEEEEAPAATEEETTEETKPEGEGEGEEEVKDDFNDDFADE